MRLPIDTSAISFLGHTSPQVALRYQHVMAGRDQAIAAALDELVQAATSRRGVPPRGLSS